jgi:hypothetical protein
MSGSNPPADFLCDGQRQARKKLRLGWKTF